MREKIGKRAYLAYGIAVFLSLYLAVFFSRLYVPDIQLFLDTDRIQEQQVMAFVYDEAPVALLPVGEETYEGVVRSDGLEKRVKVRFSEGILQSCEIANREEEFIPVSRYITSNDYLGTYCVQLEQRTAQRFRVGAIFFAGILAMFGLALRETRRAGGTWSPGNREKAHFAFLRGDRHQPLYFLWL